MFYVVKENRTYDQIFGTDPRGDGDPKLELFDDNGVKTTAGGVTPKAHRLAHMFPLLDHFYADSEVSVDGHLITSGACATDFVETALHANYANPGPNASAAEEARARGALAAYRRNQDVAAWLRGHTDD